MDMIEREPVEIATAPLTFSKEFGKIAEALAKAQGAIENPKRDREVTVSTKTGGSYKFSYATLGAVQDAIRKPLSENGISYTHTLIERGARYRLVTRLMHSSGQWIESETPLFVTEQSNQAFGSALTYMKRYALCAMVGVAADEDDDGNAADGNSAEKRDRQPPARPTGNGQTNGHRKAAPKAEPGEIEMKALAKAIQDEIDTADNLKELNLTMAQRGEDYASSEPKKESDLARIRAASETAYQFLIDRANKQRSALANQPPRAA